MNRGNTNINEDLIVAGVIIFHSRLYITAEHQDCPVFTVLLTIKTSPQNISITLLQVSLKLQGHRGGYWRERFPWTILEKQFPLLRNTGACKIGNGVISLLWQLRCHCNPNHNKFSSLSNAAVVETFSKSLLCVVYAQTWEVSTLKNPTNHLWDEGWRE